MVTAMARYTGPIKLVIMDIGGTVCDGPQDLRHNYPRDDGLAVKGPVIVFDQIFQKFGMDVDWATIRRPMGKFKKEHLHDILQFEEVAEKFRKAQGRDWTEDDLDDMFDQFRPTMAQVAVTDDLIRPFDGVKECVDRLHAAGILVGCDTGYPQETCDAIYSTLSENFGITFDVTADSENVRGRPAPFLVYDCMSKANVYPPAAVVKADDITAGVQEGCRVDRLHAAGILVGCDTGYPQETCDAIYSTLSENFGITFDVTADSENVRGRPAPFLVYDCMSKANVYPPAAVVKADDITAGVQEGCNSGAWTVGIYATGAHDYETLKKVGPDYLIPAAKDLPDIVFNQIQPRLKRGEFPGQTIA